MPVMSSDQVYTSEIFNDPDYEPSAKHLNALYSSTLSTLNTFGVSESGHIGRMVGDSLVPIMVKEKEWVLPTRSNLRREDNDDLQFFHPLSENIMRGESLMISTLLRYMTSDINASLILVISEMAYLLGDDTNIERMSTDQVTIARQIGFRDDKFIKYVTSVRNALVKQIKNKEFPISMFLKPKAVINEKTYSRGCIVNFEIDSLYDDISNKYAGVKEPKKGYALTMHQLVQSIFPKYATTNAYSYGTYSGVAPYFCALVGGWVNMKRAVNEYCELFTDLGLFEEGVITDLSWYGGDDGAMAYEGALKAMVGLIPALDGNVGSGGKLGADVAPDGDRAKLMNDFLNEVADTVPDRSEGGNKAPNDNSSAFSEPDASTSMINPNFLTPSEPNNGSRGFGSGNNNASSFGNNTSWNNGVKDHNPWDHPPQNNGFGFGNNQSSFNNSYRPVQCTPTAAALATANIRFDGPKF